MLFPRSVRTVFLSLLLSSFALMAWSDDDGTCDIGDFLCPVPEDLIFTQCSQGLGVGTMIDPVSSVHCSVNTYPNGYNHNDTECSTAKRLCGKIQCPVGCESYGGCHCLAQWRLCSLLGLNQTLNPSSCIQTCGSQCTTCGADHLNCKAVTSALPTHPSRLNPMDLGLVIGAASVVLVVTIACGIGVGSYYFRYRGYQSLSGGIDIVPPNM